MFAVTFWLKSTLLSVYINHQRPQYHHHHCQENIFTVIFLRFVNIQVADVRKCWFLIKLYSLKSIWKFGSCITFKKKYKLLFPIPHPSIRKLLSRRETRSWKRIEPNGTSWRNNGGNVRTISWAWGSGGSMTTRDSWIRWGQMTLKNTTWWRSSWRPMCRWDLDISNKLGS